MGGAVDGVLDYRSSIRYDYFWCFKKKQDELKKRNTGGGYAEQTDREQTVVHAPTTFPKQVLNQDINQSQFNIDSEVKMERQMKESQNQVLQQQKRTERLHRRT